MSKFMLEEVYKRLGARPHQGGMATRTRDPDSEQIGPRTEVLSERRVMSGESGSLPSLLRKQAE